MMLLIIVAVIVVTIAIAAGVYAIVQDAKDGTGPDEKSKPVFQYIARPHFLTEAERDFYNLLGQAVGADYRIFAQVHLDALLDEQIKGQNWKAARAHISQKSVDFLLCDKDELRPVLAIELDDRTHERADRVERDGVVENILATAGIRLLRVQNHDHFSPQEIAQKVTDSLKP